MYEYSVGDPGTSGRNCETIASCTSSWKSASCTRARSKARSILSSVARSLSGLRLGSGEVKVVPVDTSWYSSAGVANRYAFPIDPVIVHSNVGVQTTTAFGDTRAAETVGCTTFVLPFWLKPS